MRNNETGEFELVVGNRQLLSGFFIIVLLFAVAFAMGYVVGENSRSSKNAAQAAAPATTAPTAQTPAETRGSPASAPEQPATPKTEDPATKTDSPSSPDTQPTTQPARDTSARVPAPTASAPAAAPAAVEEPAAGSYWQIIATANKDSAQTIVQSLKDKGFPAFTSPGPNNLTRVLVGPYADTAGMGRAKTELESAGFNRLVTFKSQK